MNQIVNGHYGKWVELMELEAMSAREKEIAGFLGNLLQDGISTVEQVRQKWYEISSRTGTGDDVM